MSLPLPKSQAAYQVDPFAKIGRRGAARLRLSIPARLVSLYEAHRCIVLDLSRSGARVSLDHPLDIGDGAFLHLGEIDHFASVVRQSEGANGLEFDVPLTEEQVLSVRQYAEGFEAQVKREWRERARDWVMGGK